MSNIHIVLVRPKNDINIAQVARSMAAFGTSHLHLVNPRHYIACDVPSVARNGEGVFKEARIHESLEACLAPMTQAFALTSATNRDIEVCDSLKSIELLSGNIAFVFGPEENGLTRDELLLCQQLLTLPTTDLQPSLNLAHAVTVVLYEVRHMEFEQEVQLLPKMEAFAALDEKIVNIMKKSNFELDGQEGYKQKELSHIFKRGRVSEKELRLILAFFDKVQKSL